MTAGDVIQLSEARAARSAVTAAKDGDRFLMEVTAAESHFLSYFYQHGHEKSALRLLKLAESGPDWNPNDRYLSVLYVTDGEVEFLRFMNQKGPIAAAKQLMNQVNKPLPDEADSWGQVLSIATKGRERTSVTKEAHHG
jgi:hypothetical protein